MATQFLKFDVVDENICPLVESWLSWANPADFCEKLSVIGHAVMLTAGFVVTEDSIEMQWKSNSSICRVEYFLPQVHRANLVKLVFIKQNASYLLVHAFVAVDGFGEQPTDGAGLNCSKEFSIDVSAKRVCDNTSELTHATIRKYASFFYNNMVMPLSRIVVKRANGEIIWSLSTVPLEIKNVILSYLGAREMVHLMSTCRQLYALGRLDQFWKPIFLKRFGRQAHDANEDSDSYYQRYRRLAALSAKPASHFRLPVPFHPWSPFTPVKPSPFLPIRPIPGVIRPPEFIRPPDIARPQTLLPKIDFFAPGGGRRFL